MPAEPPPAKCCTQVSIQGTDFEIVTSYRFLGVHLINKLEWNDNTIATYKNGQRRLHLSMKLRCFGVQGELLRTVYDFLGIAGSSFLLLSEKEFPCLWDK